MAGKQHPAPETRPHPDVVIEPAHRRACQLDGRPHVAAKLIRPSSEWGPSTPLGLKDALSGLGMSLLREPAPFFRFRLPWPGITPPLLADRGYGERALVNPDPGDARFRNPAWEEHPYFDTIERPICWPPTPGWTWYTA